jgi:CspA family cold shock protein
MSSSEQQRITGKVKWFNNKSGFGFVTAMEGDLKDKDIFVHFSSIHVPDDQYKYLVQGEYVEFELTKSDKSGHEFHAVNISGMKGGSLMCETRRQLNETRPYKPRVYKTPDADSVVGESAGTDAAEPRSAPKQKSSKRPQVKDSEGFTKIPVRRTKTTGK